LTEVLEGSACVFIDINFEVGECRLG